MQTIPRWAELWEELVNLNDRWHDGGQTAEDHWNHRARTFSAEIAQRWSRPDKSREFFISQLRQHPGSTLLDIGAGTGAWAVLASPLTASVTAVERSPGMIEVMAENLEKEGISNVRIVQGSWPDVEVEPHDFSLCSHAMYGAIDLPGFICRMIEVTRQTCFLLIRAPKLDGMMAEFARMVFGHPYDSPNFVIAYNTLIEMGIFANVQIEDAGHWKAWAHDSLEEALADVKRRLSLQNDTRFDANISRRLEQELVYQDGKFVWPQAALSALIYWDVG